MTGKQNNYWRIALMYQKIPAQFHGGSEFAEVLTGELQKPGEGLKVQRNASSPQDHSRK